MDYHSNRFEDYSLMIYDDSKLIACVPAHSIDNSWYSHRGLTYGGIIVQEFNQSQFDHIIESIENFLLSEKLQIAEFNLPPCIYNAFHHSMVASFIAAGYRLSREQVNMHATLDDHLLISSKKSAGYRNGKFDELVYKNNANLSEYYKGVLEPSLQSRFDTKPIHSLEELLRLHANFPKEIIVHAVYYKDQMIAGVLYFIKNKIAKSQYAASTTLGFKKRAMDFLYQESIKEFKKVNKFAIDFGTIHSPNGSISEGMRRFKQELGAQPSPMMRFEKKL